MSSAPLPSDPSSPALRHRARQVWNAVNLSTALGLALAAAAGCRVRRGPRGLILAFGYRWGFPDGGAFTVGNVVLLRPRTRPTVTLLGHEDRHAWQWAGCLGLPFLPLYALAVAWSLLRTGDTASRNVFERRAGLVSGGYRERPVRSLRAARSPQAATSAPTRHRRRGEGARPGVSGASPQDGRRPRQDPGPPAPRSPGPR